MDWPTFTVEIAKAIAWPAAAIIIALSFREQIRALLVRMKKGKIGPAEFEFEETVRELRKEIEVTPSPSGQPDTGPHRTLRAETEPRSVILESWLKVDAAAEKLARKHGAVNEQLPQEFPLMVRTLRLRGVIDWEHEKLYRQLRLLRNSAAHELDFMPSTESVLSFVSLSQSLAAHFVSLAGEA